MLQLPVLGVRRLGVIVLLAGASCSAPDSSGLFGPAASAPLDGEASSADEPSANPVPGGAASDSNPAVSAPDPAPELPGVSVGEGPPASGGLIPPAASADDGASVPVVLPVDAGVPLAEPEPEPLPDAGAAPQEPSTSPESPTSPEPSEPSEPEPSEPEPSEPEPPQPEPPQPEPPSPAECGGAVALGQCWYVGARNQSCDAVCAARGGVSPASVAVIGTPEQGGSLEGCDAVVQALGGPAGVVNEGYREDELGFGCHVFIDADGVASAWWLTAPAYTPSASAPSVQPLCGCAR